MVEAAFICSDDFANPNINHKIDLEFYIIKKYKVLFIYEDVFKVKNYYLNLIRLEVFNSSNHIENHIYNIYRV